MTISQFYAHSQWGPSNDTTAPVTTADYDGSWHTSPLTIHFTATDSGSGVDYTQYSLDGGAHWTNGNAVTIDGPSASTVSFRSADQAGNLEQAKTVPPLQIDPTAPTATATASPSGWTAGNVSVTFSASDAESGLNAASATCSVDGVPQAFTYGNPVSITTPGDHTVVFTVKDVAGNTGTAQVHALIDRSAPTANAIASPATWTNGTVAVSLTATDGQSGVDTGSATYSIDGGAAQPLAWGTPVTVNTVGTHTVSFSVKDMMGNVATASAQSRIDRTAPVTTVDYSSTAWQKTNVTLNFTATDAGGSGVSYTQSSVNGGTTWAYGTSRMISADGQWTVLYRSVDAAGNVETPNNSVLVKLDKTPPAITIAAPLSQRHLSAQPGRARQLDGHRRGLRHEYLDELAGGQRRRDRHGDLRQQELQRDGDRHRRQHDNRAGELHRPVRLGRDRRRQRRRVEHVHQARDHPTELPADDLVGWVVHVHGLQPSAPLSCQEEYGRDVGRRAGGRQESSGHP